MYLSFTCTDNGRADPECEDAEVDRIMAVRTQNEQKLLTPAEVASMFRVDPKTVTRWAKAGKLSSIRTLGGHRRYWEAEVRQLLEQNGQA